MKILAVAGSLREGSWNRKLLRVGVEALRRAGAEVDVLDLREVPLPLYDGDLEEASGLPAAAQELKHRLAAAPGWLISSPEYNTSVPGTFKNAIDWASRGEDDPFEGKVAALMAASPGRFGGIRMMPHLRQILTTLGVWLLPDQVTLAGADKAFAEDGSLTSEFFRKQVESLAAALVAEVRRR